MLSVTLRQLEYAVATARDGGMGAAAERLHVSQPALSVALAQLEGQLGKQLFLRRPGEAIVPTPFGRAFLDDAERILADIARLTTEGGGRARPVTLGCFEDLAPLMLGPILRRLGADRPDLTLTPRVGGFEALAEDLRRGRIDMAITYDLGLDDGFFRTELARLAPHAVLAADDPLAGLPALSLADLARRPLILADQGLSVGHMRALFGQHGLAPRIVQRAASLETMRSLAANGLGIGLSYTRPAPGLSYDGRPLVTRPLSDAGAGEPVVLVHLAGLPLSQAAADVAALLPTLDLLAGA